MIRRSSCEHTVKHLPERLLLCERLRCCPNLLTLLVQPLLNLSLLLLRRTPLLRRLFHLAELGLVCLIALVGAEDEVEVAEGGREVVHESHVVVVVVLRASPEREPVLKRPGEVYELDISKDVEKVMDG